jgi:hypothetical protein
MSESVAACRVLAAHYRDASHEDREVGRQWYPGAYELCREIAGDAVSPAIVARVMAILSPRCTWSMCVTWTRAVVSAFVAGEAGPPAVSTGANRRKAWAELNGQLALSGQKTTAFAAAIQGNKDAIVIDSWVLRSVGLLPKAKVTRHRQRWITRAYHEAAQMVGEAPRDLQAIVWCAIRGASA